MLVSVITPFFEGNKYIPEYERAILKNEECLSPEDSLEVIIVNDKKSEAVSLSGTMLIKKNVRVLTNEENLGIHRSRLKGLAASKGEYIIFLDQDDTLSPDAVKKYIEAARENKEAAVIVGNAILQQREGELLWYRTAYHKERVSSYKTYKEIGNQIISPGQCLIKKSEIPSFWKEHPLKKNGSDDYFLFLLLLSRGAGFKYIDEITYTHSFTGENISNDTKKTDESAFEFLDILEKEGDETGITKEDIKEIRKQLITKDLFRNGGIKGKLKASLTHPIVVARNVDFKIRSRTGYGFNRNNNDNPTRTENSGAPGNT